MMAKMNAFIEELTKAGKLIATEGRKAGAPGIKIAGDGESEIIEMFEAPAQHG